MNIKEILEKNGIDAEKIGALEKEINTAVGLEFVAKKRYDDKLTELATAKTDLQLAQDNLSAASAWEQKYKDEMSAHGETKKTLKKEFDEFRAGVESEKLTLSKQNALRKHLSDDKANPKLLSLLEKEFDLTKVELDGEKIKDWENLSKPVKEKYIDLFKVEDQKLFKPGNSTGGEPGKSFTKEQIKSMTPQEINQNWDAVRDSLKNINI